MADVRADRETGFLSELVQVGACPITRWITYPPAHTRFALEERIARAWGNGETIDQSLAQAKAPFIHENWVGVS
jgi:hypothetical protein